MVKLIHRILQLAVQHTAVGYNNHRLEDLLILRIVQTGQTMRQPCDGIGFTGARTVLNEIILAGTIPSHIIQQLGYHIQLVIAREDHAFGLNLAGLFIPFDFQMQILVQDFQQAVLRQHILPQICSIISIRIRRIACAAHIARALGTLIEGQKIGFAAFQLRGHVYPREIHREMHQHALLEGKDSVLARAVKLILLDSIGSALAGELALQLHAHHGNAVDEQHDINAVLIHQGIVELAGAVQDIGRILLHGIFIDGGFRLPEYRAELDAAVCEALAQHTQQADHLHLAAEAFHNLLFAVRAIDFDILLPRLRLAGLDEGHKRIHIQRQFPIKRLGIALYVTAPRRQELFNILFKAFFGVVESRHSASSHLSCNLPIQTHLRNLISVNTNAC